MAGRLDATRSRVEGVGSTVRGVNVGPSSMGVIGSGFSGAAEQHLRLAEEHLDRTTQAVDQAQAGTRGTAAAYRDTDTTSAASLSSIDSTTRPPAVGGGGPPGGGPPGGGPPGGGPPGGGPPGGGGPPPVHPPGGGGGSGPPPTTSTGGPPPRRNPWKDLVRKNFSDEDYAKFERAMDKMSRDPETGHLPGSGRLTMEERKLMARAQKLAEIRPDTTMHKTIPAADWPNYQSGSWNSVGGFVARSEDMTHLHSSDDIMRGQRLDYAGTKFHPGDPVYVIEFPAGDPSHYQVPFGSSYEPGLGQNSYDPNVVAAEGRMVGAAHSEGFHTDQIDRDSRQWPNTGTGVTGDSDIGVPEMTVHPPDGSGRIPIPDGARAYMYDAAGNKVYVGEFDESIGRFR
jgi:hypothetical protein